MKSLVNQMKKNDFFAANPLQESFSEDNENYSIKLDMDEKGIDKLIKEFRDEKSKDKLNISEVKNSNSDSFYSEERENIVGDLDLENKIKSLLCEEYQQVLAIQREEEIKKDFYLSNYNFNIQ